MCMAGQPEHLGGLYTPKQGQGWCNMKPNMLCNIFGAWLHGGSTADKSLNFCCGYLFCMPWILPRFWWGSIRVLATGRGFRAEFTWKPHQKVTCQLIFFHDADFKSVTTDNCTVWTMAQIPFTNIGTRFAGRIHTDFSTEYPHRLRAEILRKIQCVNKALVLGLVLT